MYLHGLGERAAIGVTTLQSWGPSTAKCSYIQVYTGGSLSATDDAAEKLLSELKWRDSQQLGTAGSLYYNALSASDKAQVDCAVKSAGVSIWNKVISDEASGASWTTTYTPWQAFVSGVKDILAKKATTANQAAHYSFGLYFDVALVTRLAIRIPSPAGKSSTYKAPSTGSSPAPTVALPLLNVFGMQAQPAAPVSSTVTTGLVMAPATTPPATPPASSSGSAGSVATVGAGAALLYVLFRLLR
jgi:hypothetical protein